MKRRRLLAGLGGCSIPVLLYANRPPRQAIEVRYWLSTHAAAYDVYERIEEYLEAALDPVYDEVDLSFGGAVPVENEHGHGVTMSGEWPRLLLAGYGGAGDVEPAADVNLLVTDGPMRAAPTGVAISNIASVGGGRYLERIPPRDDVDVEPYETSLRVMQVVIHEVGHVLGLKHEHGSITEVEDGTVASPMVSSYAWMSETPHFDDRRSACGERYPRERDGARYLSFDFSDCAQTVLRKYRGRLRP